FQTPSACYEVNRDRLRDIPCARPIAQVTNNPNVQRICQPEGYSTQRGCAAMDGKHPSARMGRSIPTTNTECKDERSDKIAGRHEGGHEVRPKGAAGGHPYAHQ